MEKCLCGGEIHNSMMLVNPPKYKKSCFKCGKTWIKKRSGYPDTVFVPNNEWDELKSALIKEN